MTEFTKTTREAIEEAIQKKLEDPSISAEDLEHLAKAYSELHKDDNLKELLKNNIFNTPPSFNESQLRNVNTVVEGDNA